MVLLKKKKWGCADLAGPTQHTDIAFILTTLFHANLILRKCYISTKDTANDHSLNYSELCEALYSVPYMVQNVWKSELHSLIHELNGENKNKNWI